MLFVCKNVPFHNLSDLHWAWHDLQVESLLRAKEEELHRWEASLKRELSVSDNDQHHHHQQQQQQPQPPPPQPQPTQRFTAQPPPTHSFPVGLPSQPSTGSYTMLAPPPGHPGTRHSNAQAAHHAHIDYGELLHALSRHHSIVCSGCTKHRAFQLNAFHSM